jgi:hypothetical protein
MATYPAPTPVTAIFNASSYLQSFSDQDTSVYLRKAGGQTISGVDTFSNGIKTANVKDTSGNSLLTTTGLGANVVSSSLTSVGTPLQVGGGTESAISTSNTLLKVVRSSRSTDATVVIMTPQNTTQSDKTSIYFGQSGSTRNCGLLYFNYDGNGSTNNNVFLGFNAGDGMYIANNGGNIGIKGLPSTSYALDIYGNLNVRSGSTYKLNGTDVLSSTTLGSGITSSSLTSIGQQTSGVDIASGQSYKINGTSVLSGTTLGANVVTSSLTSFGTLSGITVGGLATLGGTVASNNYVNVGSATDTAYVDFHSLSTNSGYYDSRIISTSGTLSSNAKGTLQIQANTLSVPELNTQGNVISTGSSTNAIKVGYPLTQTSGSTSSIFGPFMKSSAGWKNTTDDSGIYVNFATIVPTSCDNYCGHFYLYLKSTVSKRTSVKQYAINKVNGKTLFNGLTLLHDDNYNNVDAGYSVTAAAGTGDIVYWNVNATNDYYSWMFVGAC